MMSEPVNINEQIQPELWGRLRSQAREQGETVNNYLQRLLDEVDTASTDPKDTDNFRHSEEAAGKEAMSLAEIDQILDALTVGSDGLQPLPPDFSREDIYLDHD